MSLGQLRRKQMADEEQKAAAAERVRSIYDGGNPVQQYFIDDDAAMLGGCCPRRSGKTFCVTSKVLHFAEKNPGSRILIISLTLKSTVENYWSSAPGGLWSQNEKYDLWLKFNTTAHTWLHTNGSRGLLAGAETKADIEHLRGAAAEADIVVIDECKSFAPGHLQDLIDNVVLPGLMTRNGQLILIGTPGSIPMGPFYEATCLRARKKNEDGSDGAPTCIMWQDRKLCKSRPREEWPPIYRDLSDDDIDELFSLHTWTIQDNIAVPGQWAFALRIKRRKNWPDDHPTWLREFLGQWVSDIAELVYAYVQARSEGKCFWVPDYEKYGVTGLNPDEGPWHLMMGIDLGFVDESAVVVVAWSETIKELRHVYDWKKPGLDAQSFVQLVLATMEDFPAMETVVADIGSGGSKMIIEMLNQRYGQCIQAAKKTEKNDHIDMMNGDFISDKIKILAKSELENELQGLQWDLSNDAKHILARTGRLREDPSCPNHLCDALLYIWRFAYHYWAESAIKGPAPGTKEYQDYLEAREIQKLRDKKKLGHKPKVLGRRDPKDSPMTREELEWRLTLYKV
jgi:hypothetical protein